MLTKKYNVSTNLCKYIRFLETVTPFKKTLAMAPVNSIILLKISLVRYVNFVMITSCFLHSSDMVWLLQTVLLEYL